MKTKYDVSKGTKKYIFKKISKRTAIIILCVFVVLGGLMSQYNKELRPVSGSQIAQDFVVKSGDTISLIANNLEKQHLIRNALALKIYAYHTQLQAGTYSLSPSLGSVEIVKIITKGKVATKLVTILPGRRIDQVRADLINSGFTPTSVDAALMPDQYRDLPVMAYAPINVSTLEGLLWPDSYQKTADTDASIIVREALTEAGLHLTSDVKSAFQSEGLSIYQGLILSSIIVKEVSNPSDQAQAAQVFLSRLKIGMQLGSDVTAIYGSLMAGMDSSLTYDTPYNTLIHTGLPPTPISTVTSSALTAATHPASTNWLYFVAGDNGTTYFSTNLKDHQALTAQYCHKLCE